MLLCRGFDTNPTVRVINGGLAKVTSPSPTPRPREFFSAPAAQHSPLAKTTRWTTNKSLFGRPVIGGIGNRNKVARASRRLAPCNELARGRTISSARALGPELRGRPSTYAPKVDKKTELPGSVV